MVQLEEVEDEVFVKEEIFEDDDDYEDTDSEISDDDEDDDDGVAESTLERIYALQDIIPPTTRRRIAIGVENTFSWAKSGLWFGGKTMFVLSTSALLLGVPFGLAVAEESQAMEFEKEQKMREMGNEMLGGSQSDDSGKLAGQ